MIVVKSPIDRRTRNARNVLRRAVTLVEVVFSIGVILIGLLGLLSILPLAGRRAQDSISLNISSTLADSVMDRLLAKKYLSSGRVLKLDNTTPAAGESFVLDPMYCSGYQAAGGTVPAIDPGNGYSRTLFPYYLTTYNPFLDPSVQTATTPPLVAPAIPPDSWTEIQPRMARAGITPISGATPFIDLEQSLTLVENVDDVPFERPDDRSKPALIQALRGTSSGLEYGKRVPTGDFTWFATINPLPGNMYASVSVVILRKRERKFDVPQPSPRVADDPELNEIGERLGYVSYAAGFSGGAGGITHVVATDRVVSRVVTGDWVMLSRTAGADTFHRWYRIAAIGNEAEEVSLIDPISRTRKPCWQHKLLLDGPDWNFGFVTPGQVPIAVDADNTYATFVDGVVTVSEYTVLLSDL